MSRVDVLLTMNWGRTSAHSQKIVGILCRTGYNGKMIIAARTHDRMPFICKQKKDSLLSCRRKISPLSLLCFSGAVFLFLFLRVRLDLAFVIVILIVRDSAARSSRGFANPAIFFAPQFFSFILNHPIRSATLESILPQTTTNDMNSGAFQL